MLYSDTSGTQLGPDGTWTGIDTDADWKTDNAFAERNENETLTVDVKVPSPELQQVADILPDVVVTVLGKSASLLDSTELANLATYKPQDLKVYIDEETTFGDFVGKLESGQMWKFVPLQDGSYGTIVYENGEPAGTPHFYDHDFLSFRMELDNASVKQAVTVAYDQDEGTRDYSYTRASSDIAKFFYLNADSVDIETFLEGSADADELAEEYLTRYQQPITKVIFEVHGWALELLPGRDKVKLTRARAAYAGGALAGVLFRIIKLVKKPETNVVEITAARWGNDEGDERTVQSPILGAFSLPAPTVAIT
jgi:hypothetical protein